MKTRLLLPLAALLITVSCSKQETPMPAASPAGAITIDKDFTASRVLGDTARKPKPISDGKPRPAVAY